MKYRILKDKSLRCEGRTLYRIQALKDFGDVKEGDVGGYIQSEANLSQEGECWVYDDAYVGDNAIVKEQGTVTDRAQLMECGSVRDNGLIMGDSKVEGRSQILNCGKVVDCALVKDQSIVIDHALVGGDAVLANTSILSGYCCLHSGIWVETPLQIKGTQEWVHFVDKGILSIGCIEMSIKEWKTEYKKLLSEENYTMEQIKEYYTYILAAEKWVENISSRKIG